MSESSGTPSDNRFGLLSILPTVGFLTVLSTAPLLYAFALSFQKYKLTSPGQHPFIFLDNYVKVVGSYHFVAAITNTLVFTVGAVIFVFLVSLIFSLALNEKFRGSGWLRVLVLIPWAIPEMASALVWRWIYDSHFGLLNALLVYVIPIFHSYQSWLGSPAYAMPAILVPQIWKEVPLCVLLFLTGYSTIPQSLYEAAKIDGANVYARFRRITIPMLKPIIQIILVYETIMGIASFAYVYILTGGGPGDATTTLSWYTYMASFSFADFGQGAAVAVIMSVISLVFIALYFRLIPTRKFGAVGV